MESLLLVLLGFFLGLVPGWWSRKQRLKVHWGALRAEVAICREKAETYLNDNVMSPLYRLPTKAYETSFPVLLSDAAVKEEEVRELSKFYGMVEDLNRGLDNAAELHKGNQTGALKTEYKRNCTKAQNITEPQQGDSNLYSIAVSVIESHF